jgi:hypothetical protein
MQLPTIKHLQSIGLSVLESCRLRWDAFGRKPWRLSYTDHGQQEDVRGPKGETTQGFPDGLPGLPYQFNAPAEAMEFLNGCVEKLRRACRK